MKKWKTTYKITPHIIRESCQNLVVKSHFPKPYPLAD